MNAECLMQWNRLKKEAGEDFPFEKLEKGIDAYLQEKGEAGERTVCAALRSIRQALKCSGHEDEAVRRKAGKLLKSCRHSFDEACKNGNLLRKELTDARERRAETEATPRTIPLSGEFRLEEVLSLKKLMAIGKTLDICVRKRGVAKRYLKEIETGESRLWLLLKGEGPFALLKIDLEDSKVVGFSAHENDDPEISYELAMKILHKLGVTADNETSFARVGAFGRFKGGRPEVEPVRVGDLEMWIWFYGNELIVGMEEDPDGKLFWSRFQLTRDSSMKQLEWDDVFCNHLSLGILFEIVRRNPHVLEKFRSPIPGESPHLEIAA